MSGEVLTFHNGEEEILVTLVENLCYCHDTNSWRDLVMLATQGGRKTTASRIGKRDGRLWNLPFPPGMSVARFADGEPAIFARPENEFNLVNCTRLQMYRKYLAPNGQGVTFDLTRGKDLICALPYRHLGDVEWNFLVAFKKDNEKSVKWFMSKEIFRLSQDGGLQKSAKARPREVQQLPPMEERECGDGAEVESSFVESPAPESIETRESRTPSFNTICASVLPQQVASEQEAILHDLFSNDVSLLAPGAIVRCRIDGSEAHGHVISVSPWDAVIDFGTTRSIVPRNDILYVMAPNGEMIDLRYLASNAHGGAHQAGPNGVSEVVADDLALHLPDVGSMGDGGLASVPFSFSDFQPSPLAPNWINSLSFEQLAEVSDPVSAQRFNMSGFMGVKAEPVGFLQGGAHEANPAFFQDLGFAPMDTADPVLPPMFVGSHEVLESALGHLDVFFPRADGMS